MRFHRNGIEPELGGLAQLRTGRPVDKALCHLEQIIASESPEKSFILVAASDVLRWVFGILDGAAGKGVKMNRRQFLGWTGGIAAALGCGRLTFAQSEVRRSVPGLVDVELAARDTWLTVAGKPAYLSAFNGQSPGPVIEARAGDTIRIRFHNALTEATNLHYHGLHISPAGMADNSFLEVSPAESMTYELNIPRDHPSGMFWYHPHMHGSVARQVSRGLAGVILIRGEFDDQPEVQGTPEFLMVLQDFDLSDDGQIIEPSVLTRTQGREGPLVTVNGGLNPAIPLQSGGWTRIRLLNASASRFYRLRIEGHTFTIVGTDGGLVSTPIETEEILLVPGQRYDAFVWGRELSGNFRLLNLPYDRLGTMGGGMGHGGGRPATEPRVLATFEYAGPAANSWTLPQQLGSVEALPASRASRSFTFGMGMGMGMMGMGGGGFTINGRRFDPNRVDTRVRLNSTEDWELVNTSMMDHPFHIHTNPFQLVGNDGAIERAWRDVVLVPAGRSVRIRLRFSDYPGKALYHCHILDHEDLGMMGTVEVAV